MAGIQATYTQHPLEKLDYPCNWTADTTGDAITASAWTVTPVGPTLSNQAFTATATTVRVTGGVSGTDYQLENLVTLASGQQMIAQIEIRVRDE